MSHLTDLAQRAIDKYNEQFDSAWRNWDDKNQELIDKAYEEFSFMSMLLLPGLVQEIKSLERKVNNESE